MPNNEAHARIKINKLLEVAGWRFFDNEEGKANILLENHVKITQTEVDAWGSDYENTKSGSLDFLLVDSDNKPFCVLEAKEGKFTPSGCKGTGTEICENGRCAVYHSIQWNRSLFVEPKEW